MSNTPIETTGLGLEPGTLLSSLPMAESARPSYGFCYVCHAQIGYPSVKFPVRGSGPKQADRGGIIHTEYIDYALCHRICAFRVLWTELGAEVRNQIEIKLEKVQMRTSWSRWPWAERWLLKLLRVSHTPTEVEVRTPNVVLHVDDEQIPDGQQYDHLNKRWNPSA